MRIVALVLAFSLAASMCCSSVCFAAREGTEVSVPEKQMLELPTGLSDTDFNVIIGGHAYSAHTGSDGIIYVVTTKSSGVVYLETLDGKEKFKFLFNGEDVVQEQVSPSIDYSIGNSIVLVGGTLDLYAGIIPGLGNGESLSYQWNKDGKPINGANSNEYVKDRITVDDAGLYELEVFDDYGQSYTLVSREVIVQKGTRQIEGQVAYNLAGGIQTQKLSCKSDVPISYSLVEGSNCAKLSGDSVMFSKDGHAVVKAFVEGDSQFNSSYLFIFLSNERCEKTVKLPVSENIYNSQEHLYTCPALSELKECTIEYFDCLGKEVTALGKAPIDPSVYCFAVTFKDSTGKHTLYTSMVVQKKLFQVDKIVANDKDYDGSSKTSLSYNVSNAIDSDDVDISLPIVEYADANAGFDKKVVKFYGEPMLIGKDAGKYSLPDLNLYNIKGTIWRKPVSIIAVDRQSKLGQPLKEFLYYTPSGIEFDGIKVESDVTEGSPPGEYEIILYGAEDDNYEFIYVPGIYTITEGDSDYYSFDDKSNYDGLDDKSDYYKFDDTSNYDKLDKDGEPDFNEFDKQFPSSEPMPSPEVIPELSSMPPSLPQITIRPDSNVVVERPHGSNEPNASNSPTPKPSVTKIPEKVTISSKHLFNSLNLDGIYSVSGESKDDTIVLDYWVTNNPVIKSSTEGVQIQYGKSWNNKQNLIKSMVDGACYQKKGLKFSLKYRGNNLNVVVSDFICDTTKPSVQLSGVEAGIINHPVTLNISVLYGVSGKGTLAYGLIPSDSKIDKSYNGWKLTDRDSVTINQDFDGKVAILARDSLGNETISYSELMHIDASPPEISGVKPGGVYDSKVEYSVSDLSGVAEVTLDGKPVEANGSVDAGTHTLTATDVNGNSSSITFTCKKEKPLTRLMNGLKSVFGR